MMVDLRSLPAGDTLETDLCIVGAGAAGIAIAREMLAPGLRVCLLESGGTGYEEATQALCAGEAVGEPGIDPMVDRLRYLGGSTNHWGGNCAPLDDIDLEARAWVPMSGWPIDPRVLAEYYDRACALCEVDPTWFRGNHWDRAPERLRSLRLPLEGTRIEEKVFLHSPPTRFGEAYRAGLEAHASGCIVWTHAHVLELETDEEGRTVTAARVRDPNGATRRVTAKRFVLAGGIENARLLLLSNRARPAGLGNDHDMVGRCFMAHVGVRTGRLVMPAHRETHSLYGLYSWRSRITGADAPFALGLKPGRAAMEAAGMANCTALMVDAVDGDRSRGFVALRRLVRQVRSGRIPSDLVGDLLDVVGDVDAIGYSTYARLSADRRARTTELAYMVEQVPNRDSRVTLGDGRDAHGQPVLRVDWRLTGIEKRTLLSMQSMLAEEFGRVGLGFVQVEMTSLDDPWPNLSGMAHFMGSTRMSQDPREGVVNPNCRVHGVSNLYVAGGSVFPTSGANMPTAVIVALALRLADHIRAESA